MSNITLNIIIEYERNFIMKRLKKVLLFLICGGMFLGNFTNVNAIEMNDDLDTILSKEVTQEEVLEVGKDIENQLNKQASKQRMDEQIYQLQSSKKLYSRQAIRGKYGQQVSSHTDQTYSVTVKLDASFSYKATSTVTLGMTGGVSYTKSLTLKGPDGDKLADGKKATHRLFFGLTFGEIYQYKYNIVEKYSGRVVGTKTVNSVVGAETFALSQLMSVNSNGSITVGNKDNTKVKTYSSLSTYKNALQAYNVTCKNVYYF